MNDACIERHERLQIDAFWRVSFGNAPLEAFADQIGYLDAITTHVVLHEFVGRCTVDRAQDHQASARILSKAEAYAVEKKFDPAVLLQARLYPDMFPLVRQIQIACDHAKGATARPAGLEPPAFSDDERNFDEIGQRIARTLEYMRSAAPASFDNSAFRKIVLKLGSSELQFEASQYLFNFALPNFFFHVTTTYDILRHGGLNIGKRDYLGSTA